jgi:hypothetical protein
MRSRSVALGIAVALLCAGGAVSCYVRASQLRSDAAWYLARGNAQAAEYSASLDSEMAEQQLASFEQRRELLESAQRWQRGQLLLVLDSVGAAFGSYLLYLFFRLRQQLVEAGEAEDLPAAPR